MFYPYGANRADCWSDSAMEQRWKYSGKELDSHLLLWCRFLVYNSHSTSFI